jgi:glucan phosphoethanolaminetransferase (alkaline phosphatase superfamily)
MNLERAILVAFFGNYIINNVVAALVALIPASESASVLTPQYIAYVILAALFAGAFAWWTLRNVAPARALNSGLMFGGIAFVVSIVTAFVTGITGVLAQTGSLSQMVGIIPNFGPFLLSWSTLVLLGYWMIPSALVGFMKQRKAQMHSEM